MSTRWTDTGAFANVLASEVTTSDLLPFADVSAAVGSQQRTLTVGTLQAITSGLVDVVSYAGAHSIDLDTDLGSHVRITAAGAVTFPEGLTVGASGVIENATVSDTVSVVGGGTVTLLSAGTEITNGKVVAWVVVNTNVVALFGAFADDTSTGLVAGDDAADLGSGAATDGWVLTADGAGGAAWEAASGGANPLTINAQTGTTYTFVLADGDMETLVTFDNANPITATVPTNASVAYPVGTVLACAQLGAGLVTIVGDTGVTINGLTPGDVDSAGQYATWTLTKIDTNTWLASGGLA